MTKLLTPRHIMILAALVLVCFGVLVSRFGGTATSTGGVPRPAGPGSTSSPTAARPSPTVGDVSSQPPAVDEHAAEGDDGADDPAPVLVQPTSAPDAREVATAFTAAWLNTANRNAQTWRDGILPSVTSDLAVELAEADPASVPAGAKTTDVTVTRQGSLVGARAPIVTADAQRRPLGTLTLTLLRFGNAWRISEIDWEPVR